MRIRWIVGILLCALCALLISGSSWSAVRIKDICWVDYNSQVMSRVLDSDSISVRLRNFFFYNRRAVFSEVLTASVVALAISVCWRMLDFGTSIKTLFAILGNT